MDRIDSMELAELRKATRELIRISTEWVKITGEGRTSCLRHALAAFEPTPLDRARKLLEDGGFVPGTGREEFYIGVQGKGAVVWYSLPKDSP